MTQGSSAMDILENPVQTQSTLSAARMAAILVCGAAAFFYFYEFILRISPSVMSKELMQAYHISPRGFGNLSAVYFYIYAPMQLLVGVLLDRFGVRRLLTIAALISALGCYLFANGDSVALAEIGRCMVAFGAAFALVGVLKLMTIWFNPSYFALASSVVVMVGMLGGMAGDIVLGLLVRYEGWRLACYLVAIVGVVVALLLVVVLQNHPKTVTNCEQLSGKLFFCACLSLLQNKQIWLSGAIGCLLYLPVLGFVETWQVHYLVYVVNYQHVDAAFAAAIVFGGCAVGAPLMGWWSDHICQRRLPLTIGAVLATVCMSCILYLPELSKAFMYVLLFFYGMATSAYILTFAVSRDLSSPALAATAFAVTNMMITLSGVFVIFIGLLVESAWQHAHAIGLGLYGISAFQIAFMIFPIALFLAVLLTFFLDETYCQQKATLDMM
jgi:MFS family permease